MIALLLSVIVFALLIGLWWGASDAKNIRGRILSGDDRDLDHGDLLGWRITWLIVGLGGTFLWLKWTGASMWLLVPAAAVAWSVFVVTHRYRLNGLRKEWWWYMGTRLDHRDKSDAKYDTLWHWCAWALNRFRKDNEGYYAYHDKTPNALAMGFEVLVLSLSVVCWIVVNMK